MAKSHGRLLVFELDTQAGVLKDLSTYTEEVNGLPGELELGDVTTAGATGHLFYPGLQKSSFSAKMVFDDATDASWDVVKSFQTDTNTRSFAFGPRGLTSGYPKMSGECRIKSIDIPAKVTEPNKFTVNFELDGGITVGTWSA